MIVESRSPSVNIFTFDYSKNTLQERKAKSCGDILDFNCIRLTLLEIISLYIES